MATQKSSQDGWVLQKSLPFQQHQVVLFSIQHFMEMLGTTDLAVPSADAPLPMTSISGFHAYLTLQSTEDHMWMGLQETLRLL